MDSHLPTLSAVKGPATHYNAILRIPDPRLGSGKLCCSCYLKCYSLILTIILKNFTYNAIVLAHNALFNEPLLHVFTPFGGRLVISLLFRARSEVLGHFRWSRRLATIESLESLDSRTSSNSESDVVAAPVPLDPDCPQLDARVTCDALARAHALDNAHIQYPESYLYYYAKKAN